MTSLLEQGFAVWLKLMLPGLAWIWILPAGLLDAAGPWKRRICTGAAAGTLGVLLTALCTMGHGLAGAFTPAGETVARVALAGAGLAAGLWIHRARLVRMLADAMPVSLLFLAGTLTILLLPHRGEWIAGGWDPGVYMNEGAALSRTGSFAPPDAFFNDLLTPEERAVFLRRSQAGIERFPGIATDPARKAFSFEFFRLTPSLFAAVHRSGGLPAMTRTNALAGMIGLACFFALIWTRLRLSHAIFATLLLAAQPIWLYHAQLPTTEMLQLLLFCACLWFATDDPRDARATGLAAMAAFALVTNRLSDLPFLGILTLCLALGSAADPGRRSVERRHLAILLAAAAGGIVDMLFAPGSIVGWQDAGTLMAVAALALVLTLSVDALASTPRGRSLVAALTPRTADILAILFLVAVAASWLLRDRVAGPKDLDNLQRLLPFAGWLPMLAGALGLGAALFVRPRIRPALLFPLFLFLFAIAWILILRKSIADLYPWATRRYVPFLIPFLAIAAGHGLSLLWAAPRWKVCARGAAALALVTLLAGPAEASRRAWTYAQYNGLGARMQDVADRIATNDVVIADHPAWGTPLALIHGKDVLGGQADGTARDNGPAIAGILPDLARRLAVGGRRLLCLTSTEAGLAVFPFADTAAAKLVWEAPPFDYQVMAQHPAARQFKLETRSVRFRLYEFVPTTKAGGIP
ncbi:MAG: hypothetical protein KJ579_12535 [Verrucomicrobia bacterium]|nr:hypothetical protein [Verrucomicrobiota bacterium]